MEKAFKCHHVTIRSDRWATSFEILRCRTRSTKVDFTVPSYTLQHTSYTSLHSKINRSGRDGVKEMERRTETAGDGESWLDWKGHQEKPFKRCGTSRNKFFCFGTKEETRRWLFSTASR